MAEVLYFIERPGPRSRYIIHHLLARMAGWPAREVATMEELRRAAGPKLVYGTGTIPGAMAITPHGILEATGLSGPPPMGDPGNSEPPSDLFAAAFWLLARMEEYGSIGRDEHGRPITSQLHLSRTGRLLCPVVDEWLIAFAKAWRAVDPALPQMTRTYRHLATMDMDNGAMYLGREWWRSIGSAAKDLAKGKIMRLAERAMVLVGMKRDPYAVHEQFGQMAAESGAAMLFNVLATDRGRHDHAVPPEHPYMRELIGRLASMAEVGLHPAYQSSAQAGMILRQKARLEVVLGRTVTHSRQHFLRMQIGATQRELVQAGIKHDHSFGLADQLGFRAGTCSPFPFYSIEHEQELPLMIHPFALMDSALAYKMGLRPAQALREGKRVVDAVRAVDGELSTVWHERFLSGFGDEAGWDMLAKELIPYARP